MSKEMSSTLGDPSVETGYESDDIGRLALPGSQIDQPAHKEKKF